MDTNQSLIKERKRDDVSVGKDTLCHAAAVIVRLLRVSGRTHVVDFGLDSHRVSDANIAINTIG